MTPAPKKPRQQQDTTTLPGETRLVAEPGSFRPDGSWDPEAPERTPVYRLVQRCMYLRGLPGVTPEGVAGFISRSPFPGILGSSHAAWIERDWQAGDEGPEGPRENPWDGLYCATSAAQTIKAPRRAGDPA